MKKNRISAISLIAALALIFLLADCSRESKDGTSPMRLGFRVEEATIDAIHKAICLRWFTVQRKSRNASCLPWTGLMIRMENLGSDYPIPMFDIGYKKFRNVQNSIKHFFQTLFTKNALDKNDLLLRDMGFGDEAFFKASTLFDKIVRAP